MKATIIADWFISCANREDTEGIVEGITPLKLQKILYLAQATHLGLGKGPLFDDEIVAWRYGPVIETIYHQFKSQSAPIKEPISEGYKSIDEETEAFLEEVWKMFGKYTAFGLVELTHSHLPWKQTPQGKIIPKKFIAEYYSDQFIEINNE